MRHIVSMLVVAVAFGGVAIAKEPASPDPGVGVAAKQGSVPPGHAKKGGVPPGLAKKFGVTVPAKAYIAIDPRYDDRAWFLIDGRWVLRQGFEPDVRVEVRQLMTLPPIPVPPPVPLPSLDVAFRVVLFG